MSEEIKELTTFEKIEAKIAELKKSTGKAFAAKPNKSQARQARQETQELRDLITALRAELLAVYSKKAE